MPIRDPPPTSNSLMSWLAYFVFLLLWAWAFEDDIKTKIHRIFPGANLDMPPRIRKIVLPVVFTLTGLVVGYTFWWSWRYTI